MALGNLFGTYLQDTYQNMAQVSKSSSSPDEIWIMSDGLGNPVNWLQLTSSYAVTAAFALNGGGSPGAGLPGGPTWSIQFNSASVLSGSSNFIYSGSLYYTGTFFVSGAISASFGPNTVGFFGTASWAQSASRAGSSSFATSASAAISSSYAITASYALNAGPGGSANVNGDDQYLARFSGSTAVETSTLYNDRAKKSLALNYNQSIAFGSESITLGKLLHAQGNYDHIANFLNSTAPVYIFTGYNENIQDYGSSNTYRGFFGLKSGDFTRKWYGLDLGAGPNPTITRLIVYQPSQNAIAIFSGSAADFGYSFYGNIESSNDLTSFASSSATSIHVNSAVVNKQPENIAWIGCKNEPINIQGTIAKSTTAVDVINGTFGHAESVYYVYVITNEFDVDNVSVYGNSLEGFGNSVYHLNPSSDLDEYYPNATYNHVEGYLNQVRGNINHVQNQENIVVGDNNDISGLYNAIYGNKNLVYGQYNGLGSTATSDFNRYLNITSVTRSNVDNQEHTSVNFPGPPNVDTSTYKINLCILNGTNVAEFAASQSLAGYYSEDRPYFAVLYRGFHSTVEPPLIIPVWSARPPGAPDYILYTSADIISDNTTVRGVNYHLFVNTDFNSELRTKFPENNIVLGNQNLLSGTGNTAITTGSRITAVDSFFVGKNLLGSHGNSINNAYVFGRDATIPGTLNNSFGVIISSSTPQLFVTRSWVGINTTTIPSSSFVGLRVANDLWVNNNSYLGDGLSDITVITGSLFVSNSFDLRGTGRVSGSFIVSNSLNVIGTSIVTGSNIVSGSWNLIGTGRVTGSLIVSNSLTTIGTSTTTGSVFITGSSTLIGNQTITGSILMTGSAAISKVEYIDFIITGSETYPTHQEGRLHWFDDTKTLQIDTDINNFMVEVGHQHVVRVYNNTGVTIPIGTVVRINGAQGNQPTIVTSSYEDDASSAGTLGFAATNILGGGGNQHGYVVTSGILRNVNTNAYTAGTQLYLGAGGTFSNTSPDAPLHEVRLGKVVVQNASTGIIYVDIMNGYELTELHDVRTTTYSNGDLLIQSNSLWINSKQLTGSYGLTGSLFVLGTVSASAFSGSLYGTASWAESASQAISSSYSLSGSYALSSSNSNTSSFSLSGNGIFSGSFSGSLFGVLSGSVHGTSSWAESASWVKASGPANSIQFNDSPGLSGSGNFLFIKSTNTVSLTGSLLVTGSSVVSGTFAVNSIIVTQAQPAMQINSEGVFVLGEYAATPTAIAGGMMFSGSEFYLGFS